MNIILHNISRIIIALISVSSIICCVKEDAINNTTKQITLKYSLEYSTESKSLTSTEGENKITEIAMLFFNKSDGKQQAHIVKEITEPNTDGYILIDISNIPDGDYDVLVLGNLKYYLGGQSTQAYLSSIENENYKTAREKLRVSTDQRFHVSKEPLPLRGETKVNINSSSPQTNMSITFKRAVSRIDLIINVDAARKFKLTWAKVCNYRTQSSLFEHRDNLGRIIPALASPPSKIGDRGIIAPDAGSQSILSGLYALPNISTGAEQTNPNTTYLMIAGSYNNEPTTYYRVNITGSSSIQMLSPNYKYMITVTGVSGAGADTEEGAATSTAQALNFNVSAWDNYGGGALENDSNGNYITVAAKSITLPAAKGSSKILEIYANDNNWTFDESTSDQFTIEKTNNNSLLITTATENTSKLARSTSVKVYNTQNTSLQEIITIVQLSDDPYLTIDGVSENITKTMEQNIDFIEFTIDPGDEKLEWRGRALETNDIIFDATHIGPMTIKVDIPLFFSEKETAIERKFKLEFSVPKTNRKVVVEITQPISSAIMNINGIYAVNRNNPTPPLVKIEVEEGLDIATLNLRIRGANTAIGWTAEILEITNYPGDIPGSEIVLPSSGSASDSPVAVNIETPLIHRLFTIDSPDPKPRIVKLRFTSEAINQHIDVQITQHETQKSGINILVGGNWIIIADRNAPIIYTPETKVAWHNSDWYGNTEALWENYAYPAQVACDNFKGADGQGGWRLPENSEYYEILTDKRIKEDSSSQWRLKDENTDEYIYFAKSSQGYWAREQYGIKWVNNSPVYSNFNLYTQLSVRCVKDTTSPR